jgi:hypothetical protein
MKVKSFIVLIFGLIVINSNSFAQDTLWKKVRIDENLTLYLPKIFSTIDTSLLKEHKLMHIKVFQSEINGDVIVVTITPGKTGINVDNSESFREAMKGIAEGFDKSISSKGLKAKYIDTLINGIQCVKGVAYREYDNNNPVLISDLFLVNDKVYSISYELLTEVSNQTDENIDKLVKNISFNKSQIKERQFETKAESASFKISYLIGQIIGFIIVIGFVVFVILYLIKFVKYLTNKGIKS